jgi:hypothetical protein
VDPLGLGLSEVDRHGAALEQRLERSFGSEHVDNAAGRDSVSRYSDEPFLMA